MFFSFIIPMYNVEKYIKNCLNSILCQSMQDFEIVVVDDGSTDNSNAIVNDMSKNHPSIKLIKKPNGGQSTARNRGLQEAQGEYVIFLDSDDFIMSDDFLSSVYSEIKKNGADVVMYRYQKYFESRSNPYTPCHYCFECVKEETDMATIIYKLSQADAFYGSAWSKAVRRSVLVDNGITFDESLKCEDIDWNYRLMENIQKLSFVDREFVAYRQREGSVTKSVDLKSVDDFLVTLERYKERYESNDTHIDKKLKEALLCTLAKYYSNLLINYSMLSIKDRRKLKSRLKSISDLLKFAQSKRPKTVAKFYRCFGFTLTVTAISFLDKIKR